VEADLVPRQLLAADDTKFLQSLTALARKMRQP
jgi:hypothetical protein